MTTRPAPKKPPATQARPTRQVEHSGPPMLYGVPQIQPAGGGHGAAASPAYALVRRPAQAWTAVVTEITQFFFSSEMLRNCGILREGRRRLFSPPRRSPPPHDAGGLIVRFCWRRGRFRGGPRGPPARHDQDAVGLLRTARLDCIARARLTAASQAPAQLAGQRGCGHNGAEPAA